MKLSILSALCGAFLFVKQVSAEPHHRLTKTQQGKNNSGKGAHHVLSSLPPAVVDIVKTASIVPPGVTDCPAPTTVRETRTVYVTAPPTSSVVTEATKVASPPPLSEATLTITTVRPITTVINKPETVTLTLSESVVATTTVVNNVQSVITTTVTLDRPLTIVTTKLIPITQVLTTTEVIQATATATPAASGTTTGDLTITTALSSNAPTTTALSSASTNSGSTASSFSSAITTATGSLAESFTAKATGTSSSSAAAATDDPQTSRTLDKRVLQDALFTDGQPVDGQVPSLTSKNNFINFCLTQSVPLTNGQQIKTGSCNPTPMGRILATDRIPSATFQFPPNFGTIPANQDFTIRMKIINLVSGNFVNAQKNYYAAPAQVDSSGTIIGHSHIVIEKIDSLQHASPTNPTTFAFFKGLNGQAVDGTLTADVLGGLPIGVYRIASINSAANHQPVLVSVAQHGSVDAFAYFTVQ